LKIVCEKINYQTAADENACILAFLQILQSIRKPKRTQNAMMKSITGKILLSRNFARQHLFFTTWPIFKKGEKKVGERFPHPVFSDSN